MSAVLDRIAIPADLAAEVAPVGRSIGPASIPWRSKIPVGREVVVLYGRESGDVGVIGPVYDGAYAVCEEPIRHVNSWVWARAWALVGSVADPDSRPLVHGQRVLILDTAAERSAETIGRVGYYQTAHNWGDGIGVEIPGYRCWVEATRWALLPCVIPSAAAEEASR